MLKQAFKYFLFSLALLVLIISARSLAEDARGEVIAVDGCVHVIDAEGARKAVEQAGFVVREMDTVVTHEGANAVIRFNDGALSVLDENSRLRVERTRWLSHLGGTIYFTFSKFFGGKREIKTRFATLGIRGTTFIVYDDDLDQAVALEEGLLDIESTGAPFEINRQRTLDEFDTFKQQAQSRQQEMREEFDEYRQQQTQEFLEYRQSFTLQPERIIRFDGIRVSEGLIEEDVDNDFRSFEAIAGELLEEFREQARRHRESMEQEQVIDEEDFE